jgi:anti-sigma regulatory factor (Ser/Thr protein kinase)
MAREPDAPAPPVARTLDRRFLARPTSVAPARHLVADWLRGSLPGPGHELMVGDVALAVSEACTNAVLHAYRAHVGGGPEPMFDIVARLAGTAVLVTVSDHGSGMVVRPDSPGLGLGLRLIDALSDALDIRANDHGTGTVVAMQFSAAGAESRAPLLETFSALAAH